VRAIARVHGGEFWSGSGGERRGCGWGWRHHAHAGAVLVDAIDPSQLLVGTCRVWRGPADGSGWSATNAISPILDNGATSGACSGDSLIRSMDVLALPGDVEQVYLGMYGSASGGGNLAGHVLAQPSTRPRALCRCGRILRWAR